MNGGDMLVHFAGIHYRNRGAELEKEIMSELKWAIEELAYDADHLNKCMEEVAEAMRGD